MVNPGLRRRRRAPWRTSWTRSRIITRAVKAKGVPPRQRRRGQDRRGGRRPELGRWRPGGGRERDGGYFATGACSMTAILGGVERGQTQVGGVDLFPTIDPWAP
jgi:hypothetical protein